MGEPIVSVIIPTYKRSIFLERAINSVLNQSIDKVQIIVVDDNDEYSKDRKLNEKVMSKYKNNEKIIYLKHKKNLNGAAARNTGIFHSKSKYIAFLDDDDEFIEKKLELQINLLEKLNNSCGGVYCGYSSFKNSKMIYKNLNVENGNFKNELLLKENMGRFACPTLFMKRSVLNELNGFDETFSRHQDLELLIRFFRKYKIAGINEILVKINVDDRRNEPNPESIILIKEKFLKKFKKDIEEMPKNLQKEVYKRHYLEITRSFIKHHNIKGAIKYYKISKMFSKISFFDNIKLIVHFFDAIVPIKEFFREKIIKILPGVIFNNLMKIFSR